MQKRLYFSVYKALIQADLAVFRQTLFDKFIDIAVWVVLTLLVMGYVMQFFGLAHDFGLFQLGGLLGSIGLFEMYGNAIELVTDFEGDRTINYSLTLPIPSWLAILSKATYYFLVYCTLSLLMFPIGKLCLWNQLDLAQIDYFKFVSILLVQNIFYACFLMWMASVIANMTKLGNIWSRYIFPMWLMGGFQFSWIALYSVTPSIALMNLANPMIYITEAIRAAILGQAGYINFWLCLLVLIGFSGVSLALGMHNLRKRLDFV